MQTRTQLRRIAILLTLAVGAASADTLYLRDGEQQEGRLAGMKADRVVFETADGPKTFKKEDLNRIQLQQTRRFDDIERVEQIADPDLKACLETQPAQEDYPADGYVVLLDCETYDLTDPGIVKDTTRTIVKVLQQRGEDAGSKNVWYFEDLDVPSVDFALTVTPDGRVLHLNDAALKNESIHAQLPEYRRLSRLRFACKEPRSGSVLDIQYTVIRKRGSALEPFYAEESFRGSAPILRKEIEVLVPSASEADVQAASNGLEVVQAAREENGGVVRLTWALTKPQPGVIDEPLMPPFKTFAPWLVLVRRATWEDLSRTYAEELAKVPALSEELRAKAEQLAREGGARAIYNHVTRSIRTVSVPQGHYRLVPHAPDETAKRGAANELDKNFLYWRLLEAAGIPSRFALIRARSLGPLTAETPCLCAFDRSAVYLAQEKAFSTTSNDLLAFGTLSPGLQGAPALIADAGGASPATTQQSTPEDELEATTFDATLAADGTLAIAVTYSGAGNGVAWMRGMKDLDDERLRVQFQQIAASFHPAAVLEDYEKTDFADLDATPSLTLRCRIPEYAVKGGDDLLMFDIPVARYDASDVGRPTREHDLFWSRVGRDTCQGRIALPEGFRVYAAPGRVRCKTDVVEYRAKIKKRGHALVFSDAYDQKVQSAPSGAYAEYKDCRERRANLSRQRVILIK